MSVAAESLGFDPADVLQIELRLLRWLREHTSGDHASLTSGTGFDFTGLKEWAPGDPVTAIDWAQSSLNNFSPLMTRECEQDSNATVVALVDQSASTCCGALGVSIGAMVCRCIAAVGLAAAFFQDSFGLIGYDAELRATCSAPPRIGRAHVRHCLDLYREPPGDAAAKAPVLDVVPSFVRRTGMLAVISDFLLREPDSVLAALERLAAVHDVVLLMVDTEFAYALPRTSAGWLEVFDVETGGVRVLPRREAAALGRRAVEWQDGLAERARARGLDVVRIGLEHRQAEVELARWVAQRRVRRVRL